MSKKKPKRIIPAVNTNLDNPIRKKTDKGYLLPSNYAHQLTQQGLKNDFIKKLR